MIVHRTVPCLRIIGSTVIYPGMNGNVPRSLLENDSFQAEVDLGIMKIIDEGASKKDAEQSENHSEAVAYNADREDAIDKPDFDLINKILEASPKQAIKLVQETLKIATVMKLKDVEKRAAVSVTIDKQIEKLTKE